MTTFQRCTNKSMGDRLRRTQLQCSRNSDDSDEPEPDCDHFDYQQSTITFGASDDIGATQQQIRGAAVVGGVAGAVVGGPVGAVAAAAILGQAAAKRECELGEAARVVGDKVANVSSGLLTNQTLDKTLESYYSRQSMRKSKSLSQSFRGCSMRASQAVLRVSQSFRQKGKSGADDGVEFHDCFDESASREEYFEDALEPDINTRESCNATDSCPSNEAKPQDENIQESFKTMLY